MNRDKSLIEFILTDRRFSLPDKIEYFLYRISLIIYVGIFLFLVYERAMRRIATNWLGFLVLLTSPFFLLAAWGRRIVIKFIEPYRQEKEED